MGQIKRFLLRFAVIIGYMFFLLLGVTALIDLGYQFRFGDEVYYLTGNLTGVPFLAGLSLLWLGMQLFPYNTVSPGIFRLGGLSLRRKIRALLAGVLVFAVITFLSTLSFQRYTLRGVEASFFGVRHTYTWNDVRQMDMRADSNGVLLFRLRMEDGKAYSFNGGRLRMVEYFSDDFDERFPGEMYDYAPWLGEQLAARGAELHIQPNLGEKLDYDAWRGLAGEVAGKFGQ